MSSRTRTPSRRSWSWSSDSSSCPRSPRSTAAANSLVVLPQVPSLDRGGQLARRHPAAFATAGDELCRFRVLFEVDGQVLRSGCPGPPGPKRVVDVYRTALTITHGARAEAARASAGAWAMMRYRPGLRSRIVAVAVRPRT